MLKKIRVKKIVLKNMVLILTLTTLFPYSCAQTISDVKIFLKLFLRMGIVDFYSGYGSYHHNIVNKWIHIIGVPLILYTFNGIGEFYPISVGQFTINPILVIMSIASLYYLSLHFIAGMVTSGIYF